MNSECENEWTVFTLVNFPSRCLNLSDPLEQWNSIGCLGKVSFKMFHFLPTGDPPSQVQLCKTLPCTLERF